MRESQINKERNTDGEKEKESLRENEIGRMTDLKNERDRKRDRNNRNRNAIEGPNKKEKARIEKQKKSVEVDQLTL